MPLSDKDFGEFFQAKANGTVRCPVCSTLPLTVNSIHEMGDPNGEMVPARLALAAGIENTEPPIGSHPFYSVSCANCGHTMFFHATQIEKWLAEKQEKSGE